MPTELDRLFDQVLATLRNEEADELSRIRSGGPSGLPTIAFEDEREDEDNEERSKNLAQLIRDMNIPQKIKMALFGNQTARQLLIRDTNRMVQMFVLENAKITENEVQEIARSTSVDDMVLRAIAARPEWMKSYQMKVAIISNPRVPVDVSLKWVKFLQDRELRLLSKSKNVPQVITAACRKLIGKREAS